MVKLKILKEKEIDSMLYQKTNEDFNKEKPNPKDPLQIINNPMQEEKKVPIFKKLKGLKK